jgi:hypothetical protein
MVDFVHRISDGFFVSVQMINSSECDRCHQQRMQSAESARASAVAALKKFTQK